MTIFRRMSAGGRRGVVVACVFALVGTLVVAVALAASKPPAPTITGSPANPTATATTASATFTFTDSAGLTFKCSLDGSAFTTCTSPKTYSGLAQGNHTFAVEAVSGSSTSNATSFSWAIIPPTPSITGHPTNPTGSTSASFTYTDTQSAVTFQCALDASSFGNCAAAGITYSNLAGGSHTFRVQAQHGTTPPSQPATFAWVIDRTAPTIGLTFPAKGGSYNAAGWTAGCTPTGICGTATDASGVASVAVAVLQQSSGKYWNGSSFSSPTRLFNTASGTANWHYAMSRPADGAYTTYVRATDTFGNVTASNAPATAAFAIDTIPPAAPVFVQKPSDPSRDTSPEFEMTDTSSPVAFNCRLDAGASANCTGDATHDGDPGVQGEAQYNNLAAGQHCFSVFATDAAGNVGSTTTYCWTITGTGNQIVVNSGSPQFTTINTNFGSALVAKVTNGANTPMSGVQVTFTAPASGPSGTFGAPCSGRTCVVSTNANGLATAPTFTANGTAGSYTVTATANQVQAPANFALINSMNFTIAGNLTPPFFPGTGQRLNLTFTNPNPSPITIAAGAITITITTDKSGCTGTGSGGNFSATSTGVAVTIPANSTKSLSDLGVATANWPLISMLETHTNQDACKSAALTLHYSGGATG